jgi:cytochrome c-type biogenesis protein CcmE
VARKGNPARLIIALSVAGVLAIFLVYVAIAGGTPQASPGNVAKYKGSVILVGTVVPKTIRPAANDGARFVLKDRSGSATVRVVYRDNTPDQFKGGREISVHGTLRNGVFVGEPGSMMTKCPSKYQAAKKAA